MDGKHKSAVAAFLCVLGLVARSTPARAVRTDVVVLQNGDRITGEVKKLEFGRLEYKTDDIGTVDIEWLNVAALTSTSMFEVETSDLRRFVGRIEPGPDSTMAVVGDQATDLLSYAEVVRISKLGAGFWSRLDGAFDLGMSFTQADATTQFNVNFELDARRPSRETALDVSGTLTDREDAERTSRFDATLSHLRLRRSRWFSQFFSSAQGNQELGLDLRVLAGGGFGRTAIQTNRTLLRGSAGLAVKEEWPVEGGSEEEIEAALGGTYSFFTFDYPNTNVDVRLNAFYGLSGDAALRLEGDFSVRRELVKDFYVSASVYESFDEEPIVATAASNDWGFTTSIGWSF